jgi:hypothetical protein
MMRVLFTTKGYTGREETPEREGFDKVYVTSLNRIPPLLRHYRAFGEVEAVIEVDPESLLENWRSIMLHYGLRGLDEIKLIEP